MNTALNIIVGLMLFILASCQSNTEKLIDTKISTIDNSISTSQPYKSSKKGAFTSSKKRKDNLPSETVSLLDNLAAENKIKTTALSDEKALIEIFSELSAPKQIYQLNPARDTQLICARGTVITIKAGSFVNTANKPVLTPVRFEVNEYLDKSEFIYASLSTNTNKGEILESGGMLLLKAYTGKEELTVGKGKSIQFEIPTKATKEGMELFSGVRDVHGNMKWHTVDKKKNGKTSRKSSSKKKLIKAKKEQVMVEENCRVTFVNGEEVFSKKYSNPKKNTVFKKEKLDTISIYFEINGENVIENSWSKRTTKKGKKKPSFYRYNKRFSLSSKYVYHLDEILREREKINLNKEYTVMDGFYRTDGFSINKACLKIKKEKKNKGRSMAFSIQRIYVYSDTLEKLHIEDEKQKLKNIESSLASGNSTDVDESEMEYYIFNTAELGWINVDRFVHIKGPKVKFALLDKNLEKSKVSLVFKKYDSVLPGCVENGKVNFTDLPLGEEVTIVAIKVENGIPMLYTEDTKIERGKFERPIEFKPVSFAELQEEMKKLNE
jgi:hypothetical protein